MSARLRLDVICPVFREEAVILQFHERLMSALDAMAEDVDARVLFVVDPGGDRTESLLEDVAGRDDRLGVLVLSRRFGHQASLVAGLEHAGADADAVVVMDADLQHPPELIDRLVREYRAGADIVQTLRTDHESISYIKRATSRRFYGVLKRLSGMDISPGTADFRLLSRRVLRVFQDQLLEQNPFLRGLTAWVGYRLVLVPFQGQQRPAGNSKYRWTTLLEFALKGITSFSKLPIRVTAMVGFGMSVLSLLYALVAVITYMASTYVAPGWTSVLAALTLVGGIQLFFLGVIAEYVGYIFDEVKGRPRYLVDRTFGAVVSRASADANSLEMRA